MTLEVVRFVVRDAQGNDIITDAIAIETENVPGGDPVDTVVMRSDSLSAYFAKMVQDNSKSENEASGDCTDEDCETCGEPIRVHR